MTVSTLVKSIQDIMWKDVGVDGDAQRISQLCWMLFLKIVDDQDQELELLKDGYRSPVPAPLQWRNWAADPEGLTGVELVGFVNDYLFPTLKQLAPSTPRARTIRDVFEDAYNYMKSGQLMRQVVNKINDIDFNNLAERQHFGVIYEKILNDLQSAGNAGEYYTPRAVTSFMAQMIDPKPGETLLDPACGTGGFLTCAMHHMRKRYVKRPEDEARMQSALRAVEKKPLPHMLAVTNMLLHKVEEPSFLRHDNTLARPYISWGQDERVDIVLTNPPFGGREEDGIESNFPKHFQTRETADLFLALIIRLLKPGGRAAVVLPDGFLFGEGVKTRLKEHLMEECNLHTIVRLPNSVFRPYASIGTNLLFFEKGEPTREVWFWEHLVPEGQKAYSKNKPIRLEHLNDCAAWWGGTHRQGREEGARAWKMSVEDIIAGGYNLDVKNPHTARGNVGDPETLVEELTNAEAEAASVRDRLKRILAEAAGAVNAEILFSAIDDGADHISKLRKIAVTLAISGHLNTGGTIETPQHPLERIKAVKRYLQHDGLNAKQAKKLSIGEEDLPEGFTDTSQFVPLSNVARVVKGKTAIRKAQPGSFPLVVTSAERATCDHFDFQGAAAIIPLVSSTGHGDASINRLHYQEGRFALGTILAAVFPHAPELISARFLFEYLSSFKDELLVSRMTGTANVTLTIGRITEVPVPLVDPAAQQKVDEIMVLCDRLAASLAVASAARNRLLELLLHEALGRTKSGMAGDAASSL